MKLQVGGVYKRRDGGKGVVVAVADVASWYATGGDNGMDKPLLVSVFSEDGRANACRTSDSDLVAPFDAKPALSIKPDTFYLNQAGDLVLTGDEADEDGNYAVRTDDGEDYDVDPSGEAIEFDPEDGYNLVKEGTGPAKITPGRYETRGGEVVDVDINPNGDGELYAFRCLNEDGCEEYVDDRGYYYGFGESNSHDLVKRLDGDPAEAPATALAARVAELKSLGFSEQQISYMLRVTVS